MAGYKRTGWYAVDAEWRYLEPSKQNEESLFSRGDDPNEDITVAAEQPDVCERMRGLVQAHRDLADTLRI